MFKFPAILPGARARLKKKPAGPPISRKSHAQKRYFSLMLVPSHSNGRTRSVRIHYTALYAAAAALVVISAVMLAFYLRSHHFMRVAQDISASLDQAQEAYNELQESNADLHNRLIDDSNSLKDLLTDEQLRFQDEKNRQRQDYQSTLDELQDQVDELERLLFELEAARQAIISELCAKSFIPPIKNIITEMEESQASLLEALKFVRISSDERKSMIKTTVFDLEDYFEILMAKIETQTNLFKNLNEYVARAGPHAKSYPTKWPVFGEISSVYGRRAESMGGGNGGFHAGIDIRCKTGTEVYAAGGGTVTHAGWDGSYGYTVVISHGHGIETLYAHNSKIIAECGQKVERGELISLSGNTGQSTGPHLHYEVRVNGKNVNPSGYLLEQ